MRERLFQKYLSIVLPVFILGGFLLSVSIVKAADSDIADNVLGNLAVYNVSKGLFLLPLSANSVPEGISSIINPTFSLSDVLILSDVSEKMSGLEIYDASGGMPLVNTFVGNGNESVHSMSYFGVGDFVIIVTVNQDQCASLALDECRQSSYFTEEIPFSIESAVIVPSDELATFAIEVDIASSTVTDVATSSVLTDIIASSTLAVATSSIPVDIIASSTLATEISAGENLSETAQNPELCGVLDSNIATSAPIAVLDIATTTFATASSSLEIPNSESPPEEILVVASESPPIDAPPEVASSTSEDSLSVSIDLPVVSSTTEMEVVAVSEEAVISAENESQNGGDIAPVVVIDEILPVQTEEIVEVVAPSFQELGNGEAVGADDASFLSVPSSSTQEILSGEGETDSSATLTVQISEAS